MAGDGTPTTGARARRRGRPAAALALAAALLAPGAPALPPEADERSGHQIMEEALRRHEQYPYVYEEQTMVLMDGLGNRDVRKARRYSRVDEDGVARYLLVFDGPPEIRGVALLAERDANGRIDSGVYLPAFGPELKSGATNSRGSHFLGTDFSIDDLAPEVLGDFRYVRVADRVLDETPYFVIEALPRDAAVERATGQALRRHYVRQDNYFVVRTDYYDRRTRFYKRQTRHDLKRVSGSMWRANMIIVHDHREQHRTLLKIDHRVFSRDYVPAEMFTPAWLFENRHLIAAERRLFQGTAVAEPSAGERSDGS